jgi:hypothetical protein
MGVRKVVALVSLLLAGVLLAEAALAHGYRGYGGNYRGHGGHYYGPRYSVSLGFGMGWPYGYYPAPYYNYPPQVVVVPSQPQTYIQQESAPPAAAPAQPAYWYYCGDARQYYPYVKECPGGWQRVSPQPPR